MQIVRCLVAIAAALLILPLSAVAQTAPPQKKIGVPSKQKHVDWLIVLNAKGAKLSGQTLVLEGPQPSAIVFSDRPVRSAGHMPTGEVVDLWKTGSFARVPPNATVSAFSKDGNSVSDAVLVLKKPKWEGDKLAFEVDVLEGDLGKADGAVAVFIDTVWFGIGGGGVHYLGSSRTTGGTSPAIGSPDDTSTYSGWSNPAPSGRSQGYRGPAYPSLSTPPDAGGPGGNYRAPCGAPPLLPCY
ncbi:MAG: hypothetical protein KIT25_12035 [Enhydrobacter sp.]|nr:MAG: hypothetical protein KIT25_12035 [Enhydrobacter sp.]